MKYDERDLHYTNKLFLDVIKCVLRVKDVVGPVGFSLHSAEGFWLWMGDNFRLPWDNLSLLCP